MNDQAKVEDNATPKYPPRIQKVVDEINDALRWATERNYNFSELSPSVDSTHVKELESLIKQVAHIGRSILLDLDTEVAHLDQAKGLLVRYVNRLQAVYRKAVASDPKIIDRSLVALSQERNDLEREIEKIKADALVAVQTRRYLLIEDLRNADQKDLPLGAHVNSLISDLEAAIDKHSDVKDALGLLESDVREYRLDVENVKDDVNDLLGAAASGKMGVSFRRESWYQLIVGWACFIIAGSLLTWAICLAYSAAERLLSCEFHSLQGDRLYVFLALRGGLTALILLAAALAARLGSSAFHARNCSLHRYQIACVYESMRRNRYIEGVEGNVLGPILKVLIQEPASPYLTKRQKQLVGVEEELRVALDEIKSIADKIPSKGG